MSPPSQAQALYAESKQRLAERVQASVVNVGSVARQVVKGSKCPDVSDLLVLQSLPVD